MNHIKYFVGIDNSLSGAVAIVDIDGNPVDHMQMPSLPKDDEVDDVKVLKWMQYYELNEDNCIVALERPIKFCKGQNAFRIMWFCFGKLKAAIEITDYTLYCPDAVTWQSEMIGTIPSGKTKEYAHNKVIEIWGKPFEKTKKLSGGVNDAYLIAEWLRRRYLGSIS
jgi:hypothetical protein